MPYPIEVPRSYWNQDGEPIPAPRPVWTPRKGEDKPGEDDFVLTPGRRDRRAMNRKRASERRKMQARYVRREWVKETEKNQLGQLFALIDGTVPASSWVVRSRARTAINTRVVAVREQDQARYDKEIAARQKNRNLSAPKPVMSHEEILQRLRAVAA